MYIMYCSYYMVVYDRLYLLSLPIYSLYTLHHILLLLEGFVCHGLHMTTYIYIYIYNIFVICIYK